MPKWRAVLVALSLSVGWGIRGNFGHEIGAMLPGALAAFAAVILSDRADWHRRIAFFGAAGALGWSVGGSMSYMQVIGYTHSGHTPTVLYGFACLFVLGFQWAALGGAAVALPAFLNRDQLTGFFAPLATVAAVWTTTSLAVGFWDQVDVNFRQDSPLYWFDTNWLDAIGVLIAVGGLALIRRRWDFASSLLMHAAIGWWVAFLLLVVLLDLRMTPPRGDNWAGAVGIVGGLIVFLHRHHLSGVTYATVATGAVGGLGFAGAALIKLTGIATGWSTNWHSVLEQTYGFINGLGVAWVMFRLARMTPPVTEEPSTGSSTVENNGESGWKPLPPLIGSWTEPWAAGFAVLGVTYLNLRQNQAFWVEHHIVPPSISGIPAAVWHESAWCAVGIAFVVLAIAHRRAPLALIPTSWLGIGQLLYLALLWAMVVGNLLREITVFTPQRLVTEGILHLNALVCTVGLLTVRDGTTSARPPLSGNPWARLLLRASISTVLAACLSTGLGWAGAHALFGERPAESGTPHIRFGSQANATKAKPAHGQPHP